MILPTKGISPERSLLAIGGEMLEVLSEPMSISRVWDIWQKRHAKATNGEVVSFDWFLLAADMLYAVGAVSLDNGGRLVRTYVSRDSRV